MLCRKFKKVMVAGIIMGTVLSSVPNAYAVAETKELTINDGNLATLSDTEKSAERQIQSIANATGKEDWKDCDFGKKIAMFDYNNMICAYYFELKKNGEKCGYIIIDSDNANRIIEYSYGKDSFVSEAKEDIAEEYDISDNNQKIYYLGGLSYAIGGTDENGDKRYVDISTNDTNEISKSALKNISISNNTEEISKASPPDSKGGGFITDPSKYEKKYDSSKKRNIKNCNLNYKVMTSFSNGGVCAPTAATNCMFYWYNRGNKYKKLLNGTWQKTFNSIYRYMETSKKGGTKDSMLATGYSKYLSKKGYDYSVKFHRGTSYGKDLLKELNKDRPCHLVVHDHYKYGDHSVLAVGYQQFIYEHWYGDNHETYIRIADGWTNKANRYVWGSCKGNWNYVSIQIK